MDPGQVDAFAHRRFADKQRPVTTSREARQ
jgi:hypothetical protein